MFCKARRAYKRDLDGSRVSLADPVNKRQHRQQLVSSKFHTQVKVGNSCITSLFFFGLSEEHAAPFTVNLDGQVGGAWRRWPSVLVRGKTPCQGEKVVKECVKY